MRLTVMVHGHVLVLHRASSLFCGIHGARVEGEAGAAADIVEAWLIKTVTAGPFEEVAENVRRAIKAAPSPPCCLLGDRRVASAVKKATTKA